MGVCALPSDGRAPQPGPVWAVSRGAVCDVPRQSGLHSDGLLRAVCHCALSRQRRWATATSRANEIDSYDDVVTNKRDDYDVQGAKRDNVL